MGVAGQMKRTGEGWRRGAWEGGGGDGERKNRRRGRVREIRRVQETGAREYGGGNRQCFPSMDGSTPSYPQSLQVLGWFQSLQSFSSRVPLSAPPPVPFPHPAFAVTNDPTTYKAPGTRVIVAEPPRGLPPRLSHTTLAKIYKSVRDKQKRAPVHPWH